MIAISRLIIATRPFHVKRLLLHSSKMASINLESGAFQGKPPNFKCSASGRGVASRATTAVFREQSYDYFLVLDFEATCDNMTKLKPQEIIEFPVLKVNGTTFTTEATFHQYVQPQIHKELTSFCTQLTGIVQDMVDGQPHIDETLHSFNKWMADEGLLNDGVRSIFVTCGDWDLKQMLPSQTRYFDLRYGGYLKSWINIKKPFADVAGSYGKGMMSMLSHLKIKHEGRHHSGIDDCKNIANILSALAERGHVFTQTGYLQ